MLFNSKTMIPGLYVKGASYK